MNTYMLFAIFGASGAGKTELFKIIQKVSREATVHVKDSTRELRESESPDNMADLHHVDQVDPNRCTVSYRKFGEFYGIVDAQITEAYVNRKMHFIIIRDIQAIRKLLQMHPEMVVIYVHCDPHQIKKQKQKREGLNPRERKRRVGDDYHEYVRNITLFDHVVVNFWDIDNAVMQVENIIGYYQKEAASIRA